MKNKILLYTVIVSLFSFNCWTQKKIEETKVNSNSKNEKTNKKIKYYHVEETSPLKFGGFKTTYDVRDPKLIRTYDLGPNKKRTITPVYKDVEIVEKTEPTIK